MAVTATKKRQRQFNVNSIKAKAANKSLQATRYIGVSLKLSGSGKGWRSRQVCRCLNAVA
jgi:hypothetical protein